MWVWSSLIPLQTSPPDVTIQEEEELEGEELTAKREEFKNKLKAYYDSKGKSFGTQYLLFIMLCS